MALAADERKFFFADKDYYDAFQKTAYHTICESTQPIHEIVTITPCQCLILTRPSLKTLQQCDVKINTKNSVFWKHISSLKAWIFSTKNPEPISTTCKKERTEKGHITNSGILRLHAGCTAKTEHTTLIGTQINVNSEEFIYNPGFSLNISEISPTIYKTMHIPSMRSFLWETEKYEKLKNLHTEESLSTIEEQLRDLESNHNNRNFFAKVTRLLHENDQKYFIKSNFHCYLHIFPTTPEGDECHANKTVRLLNQTSSPAILVHFRTK